MDKLDDYSELIQYLDQVIGAHPIIEGINSGEIPFYLRSRYSFASAEFMGFPCVLFSPRPDTATSWTPKSVRQDGSRLSDLQGATGVFICSGMRADQRKRLIELRVPFIDPGYQLYLPDLMIDLRERFKAERAQKEYLSPSAQHMLLYVLQLPLAVVYDGSHMAEMLNTTRMTISRAFAELSDLGLAKSCMIGRTKQFLFREDRRAVWEEALPYLRSPVGRGFDLYHCPGHLLEPARLGGISGLAEYSNLNPPGRTTWVISKDWYHKNAVAFEGCEAPSSDWGNESLEIWKYGPIHPYQEKDDTGKRTGGGRELADRLSLYLSLKDSHDERVQQALETLIEEAPW
jgi:hypothetical protein